MRFDLPDEYCDDVDDDLDEGRALASDDAGDAGSAAARARKTAWVPRDKSDEFGLAFRASAYRTFFTSFFLIDASKVSTGVENCERADEIGATKACSEYLAVIKRNRSSRDDIGVGLMLGPKVASQMILLTRLPMSMSSSTISCVKETVSRVSDRTFDICVPRDRWIPLHSIQRTIPRLMDTHSTLLAEEQSAHCKLPASAALICCNSFELTSSVLADLRDGRSPTVA